MHGKMHVVRITAALAVGSLITLGCRSDKLTFNSSGIGPRFSETGSGSVYQEPVDTLAVSVDLSDSTLTSDSLEVRNSIGRKGWRSGSVFFVEVPKQRPSVVYVLHAITLQVMAFDIVRGAHMATHALTVTDAGSLKAAAAIGPMLTPGTLADADSLYAGALSATPSPQAAAEFGAMVRAGGLSNASNSALPTSASTYLRAVGSYLGTQVASAQPYFAGENLGTLPGNAHPTPWITMSPAETGAGVALEFPANRDEPGVTVAATTRRAFAVSVRANLPNGGHREIASTEISEPRLGGTIMSIATGRAAFDGTAGTKRVFVPIPLNEAARYWGADSSFEVRVLLAAKAIGGALSDDDKELVNAMAKATVHHAFMNYFGNVAMDAAQAFSSEGSTRLGPALLDCAQNTATTLLEQNTAIAEMLGGWWAGNASGSAAADTSFGEIASNVIPACAETAGNVAIIAMRTVPTASARWVGLEVAVGFSAVNNLPVLHQALMLSMPDASTSPMKAWGIHQTWLTAVDFRQADTTIVPFKAAVGMTVSVVPMARLSSIYLPPPSDLVVTHDTVGGVSYLASPHRFAGKSSGIGTMHASYVSSPSGTRTTVNHSVEFCGPTAPAQGQSAYRLKVLGFGGSLSNKTTVNIDTLTFFAEMHSDCVNGWMEFPNAVIFVQGSTGDPQIRGQTVTVAGSTSYKKAWFVGSGGTLSFQAYFRNPLNGNAMLPSGYSPLVTQTVGKGTVTNITPTVTNLYFKAGSSATATWTGQYIDVNGQVRSQAVCFKGVGDTPPAGTCLSSKTFSSFGIDKQVIGYSSTDPYANGQTVKVNAYQLPP